MSPTSKGLLVVIMFLSVVCQNSETNQQWKRSSNPWNPKQEHQHQESVQNIVSVED
jgi:hypothetical protein